MFISTIQLMLAVLTVIGQVFIAAAMIFYSASRKNRGGALWDFLHKNGLWAAFIVALTATLGSLFYSEIAKFTPCELCWYQRIFMYSQTFLLGLAVWRNDKNISPYAILLSGIGAAIAAYHYYLQLGGASFIRSCAVIGYSASCAQRFVMQFGYITIPLMSLTAFLMIILILTLQNKK